MPENFADSQQGHETQLECPEAVVNVAQVPQRSPFRYPGGKTWLVPFFRRWLRSLPSCPRILVEPFAGGAIISLTAIMEGLVNQVVLTEKDPAVAAVWREILEAGGDDLCRLIRTFDMSRDNARSLLAAEPQSNLQLAFQTIVRNRVNRGGIMSPGASFVRMGEAGKGVMSRWYPATLERRIRAIAAYRKRISLTEGDGLDTIAAYASQGDAAFFMDPPYTAGLKSAGKRLYCANSLDHKRLFQSASEVAGDVLMTYDDDPQVRALASAFGFSVSPLRMKSTHHRQMGELAILGGRARSLAVSTAISA